MIKLSDVNVIVADCLFSDYKRLISFLSWCEDHHLMFNAVKTKYVILTTCACTLITCSSGTCTPIFCALNYPHDSVLLEDCDYFVWVQRWVTAMMLFYRVSHVTDSLPNVALCSAKPKLKDLFWELVIGRKGLISLKDIFETSGWIQKLTIIAPTFWSGCRIWSIFTQERFIKNYDKNSPYLLIFLCSWLDSQNVKIWDRT